MRAIVAVDSRWAIGKDGGMLFHLPEDLKHFRRETLGKTVVMGRKTLESFPGGKPLPKRTNVVLSRNPAYEVEGAHVVRSLDALEAYLRDTDPDDVYLIGGQQLYERLIDQCDTAIVTRVDAQAPADSYFPNLDTRPGWRLESCEDPVTDNGYTYRICTYRRDG